MDYSELLVSAQNKDIRAISHILKYYQEQNMPQRLFDELICPYGSSLVDILIARPKSRVVYRLYQNWMYEYLLVSLLGKLGQQYPEKQEIIIRVLIDLLESRAVIHHASRQVAISTIAIFPADKVLPLIEKALNGRNNTLNHGLLSVLRNIYDVRSIDLLIPLLDSELSHQVINHLGQLASHSEEFASRIAPILIQQLCTENYYAILGLYNFIFEYPDFVDEIVDELTSVVESEINRLETYWYNAYAGHAINILSLTKNVGVKALAKSMLMDSRTQTDYDHDPYSSAAHIGSGAMEAICRLLSDEDIPFLKADIIGGDNEALVDMMFHVLSEFRICGFAENAVQTINHRMEEKVFYPSHAISYLGHCGIDKDVKFLRGLQTNNHRFTTDINQAIHKIEERKTNKNGADAENRNRRLMPVYY